MTADRAALSRPRLSTITPTAAFLVVAVIIGISMLFITPPFQVPDEVAHFWHSYAIARGEIFPAVENGRAVVHVPRGAKKLVAALWVAPGTPTKFEERMNAGARVPYESEEVTVTYPALYSPVPYLPQAAACFVGDALRLRPLVTFYLGRLATLLAVVTLVVLAIRLAGASGWIIAMTGMLPMSMFLFASYSADALTIAFSLLLFACAHDRPKALYPAAFALGLCKPPYVLITLTLVGRRWRSAIATIALAIAGSVLAVLLVSHGSASLRPDVDPAQRMRAVRDDPVATLHVIGADLAGGASEYLDQLVGRFGWLDIRLPRPVHYGVVFVLLLHLAYSGRERSRAERLIAAGVLFASIAAIELSQLITWTPSVAPGIEGVQGRYFIPLVPLIFAAFGRSAATPRWLAYLSVISALIACGTGLFLIHERYFA